MPHALPKFTTTKPAWHGIPFPPHKSFRSEYTSRDRYGLALRIIREGKPFIVISVDEGNAESGPMEPIIYRSIRLGGAFVDLRYNRPYSHLQLRLMTPQTILPAIYSLEGANLEEEAEARFPDDLEPSYVYHQGSH